MSKCLNCQAEITTAGCDCRKAIWGGGRSSGKRAYVENSEEIKKAISEAKDKFDKEITLKHYKYDNGFCACGLMLDKFENCRLLKRRELFKQVALKLDLQDLALKSEKYDAIIDDRDKGVGYKKQVQKWRAIPVFAEGKAEFIGALTEAILSAAEQFAAKQSADEFAKKGEG